MVIAFYDIGFMQIGTKYKRRWGLKMMNSTNDDNYEEDNDDYLVGEHES